MQVAVTTKFNAAKIAKMAAPELMKKAKELLSSLKDSREGLVKCMTDPKTKLAHLQKILMAAAKLVLTSKQMLKCLGAASIPFAA